MRVYAALELRRGGAGLAMQLEAAREAKAELLHVVDLEAATGGERQWSHLSRLVGNGRIVQFAGGVRSMVQVQQLLDLGVAQVVVGTQAVRNPAWARELAIIFPGRVVVALDVRGRSLVVAGRREATDLDAVATARSLDDAGFAGFLYAEVAGDAAVAPPDPDLVADLRKNAPRTPLLVALPGRPDGLAWLAGAGVAGVLVEASGDGALLRDAVERHDARGPRKGGRA